MDLNLKQGNGETICSLNSLSSLAKSCFTLGELEQTNAKKQWFEQGRHYAEILCREHPCQVEGHYWLALNLCGLSELIGAGNALLLLPTIVEHLETAVSLDKTYDQAGPLRALGWVQFRAPTWPLSEGDPVAALQHLRNAAEIAPDNITNHLYLGEALLEEGNKDEACRELQRAISSTQHSVSPCGFEGDRAEAYRLMEKCGR